VGSYGFVTYAGRRHLALKRPNFATPSATVKTREVGLRKRRPCCIVPQSVLGIGRSFFLCGLAARWLVRIAFVSGI
jgi:hypothetical protein